MKKYNSISDFIKNNKLSLDTESNDGTDVNFSIKAIETYGTVLFADLSNFTKLSKFSSTGALLLVNKFINWIAAEGFKDFYGIVDKIIGDEIMIVFSNSFGDSNHLQSAISTAVGFIEYDPYSFKPHIGIASGKITLGSIRFNDFVSYSVYGSTVNLASRFAKESEARMITLPKEIMKSSNTIKDILHDTLKFHDKWNIRENVKNIKGFGEINSISVQREETIDFIFELDNDGGISKSITIIDEINSELSELKDKGKYLPI